VAFCERVRLARQHHEVGSERRDLVERDARIPIDRLGEHVADAEQVEQRRAVGIGGERHPRAPPHRDEGFVPTRREHARQPRVPRVGQEAVGCGHADPLGQARHRVSDVFHRTRRHRVHGESDIDERGRVGEAVFLVVHDDEIRMQRDDRGEVGILRAADGFDVGLLAETRAGNGNDAHRDQCLGCGWHQRDDAHDRNRRATGATCARAAAPSWPRTRPR
jgi:hypothetical protein